VSQIVRTESTVELVTLAEQINAEHRACEVAAASAVEHAIRCGVLLLEAKERCGHGGWLKWLSKNCEVSARHAQRYMQLARDKGMINATRVSDYSLRGAMRQLRESKAVARERRRQECAREYAQRQQEFIRRVRAGEVRIPLEMAVSHTYDFEQPPDGWESWGEPVLCLVERVSGMGRVIDQPDWSDDERIWFLSQAVELAPGDEGLLTKLCGSPWRGHGETDLEASSRLFDDDELTFKPPIRELSWEGERLCLPTGHLVARLVGDGPFIWWVWDSLGKYETEPIRTAADPKSYKLQWLETDSLIQEFKRGGPWASKSLDAADLEAALKADLEVVRDHHNSEPADLSDPRVVYEIGERVLGDYEKRRQIWKRFAAFVQARKLTSSPGGRQQSQ
jgi:Protein of unknown function (DUF3102)